MKQHLLLTVLLATFTLTSCNNDGGSESGTYPDKAAYASITVAESLENSDEEVYFFTTDSGDKLFLTENKVVVDFDEFNQERIVIYYTIIENYSAEGGDQLAGADYGCDYGIRLFGVVNVLTGESVTVETQEESDEVEDHVLAYLYNSFSYSNGYINMIAGLKADDLDNIKLYLVENLSEEPGKTKEDYVNFELRYDRGTEESMGSTYEEYVSLNTAQFADKLVDKKGILLRVITSNSGTGFVQIDFEDEDEDDQELSSVSNMRSVEKF